MNAARRGADNEATNGARCARPVRYAVIAAGVASPESTVTSAISMSSRCADSAQPRSREVYWSAARFASSTRCTNRVADIRTPAQPRRPPPWTRRHRPRRRRPRRRGLQDAPPGASRPARDPAFRCGRSRSRSLQRRNGRRERQGAHVPGDREHRRVAHQSEHLRRGVHGDGERPG